MPEDAQLIAPTRCCSWTRAHAGTMTGDGIKKGKPLGFPFSYEDSQSNQRFSSAKEASLLRTTPFRKILALPSKSLKRSTM